MLVEFKKKLGALSVAHDGDLLRQLVVKGQRDPGGLTMAVLRRVVDALALSTIERSTGVDSTRFDRLHARVSAIERAKVDTSELRTLAAYIRAPGGRMEIVADFGNERLVIA